ncbi:MAG: polynucleotide adenylyltransferase PcnB [Gammaproteobacteria bacterium]|nr:polynucleotide adenylyltransferase PcnB [Gammaproteobacteria bacterium]
MQRVAPKPSTPKTLGQATVIPRSQHRISRDSISPNALKVLYRLHQSGHTACLVGGCVRDLLLDRQPKDFDIATSARPEEVRRLFRNCRLIGRRFRLAHIIFGPEIIEVATFRTHHESAHHEHGKSRDDGMIIRDNVYGTLEDDVWRRDFTVNALYYNIADFSVIDYTDGMQDIEARQLRIIGDPDKRFLEDPVRLLRAIRFAGKLGFSIHPDTEQPLSRLSHLLHQVSPARLFQETLKLFQEGATQPAFHLLKKYHLLESLFAQTAHHLKEHSAQQMLEFALIDTDQRVKEQKKVSPSFLITVFLWHPILHYATQSLAENLPPYVAYERAVKMALEKQLAQLAMPRRLTIAVREIVQLQYHFTQRRGARVFRAIEHPRFRAAYDLLMLRARSGEDVNDLASWWTQFQFADHPTREKLLKEVSDKKHPTKRRRRKPQHRRPITQAPQS